MGDSINNPKLSIYSIWTDSRPATPTEMPDPQNETLYDRLIVPLAGALLAVPRSRDLSIHHRSCALRGGSQNCTC
jgi:hypothetical protein